MREEWKTVPMGQLCSIASGKSDTIDAVENGPYAFFDRSRNIKKSSRFLYDCDALIIPGEGTEFLPKHFTGKFDLHQRAYALFDFSPQVDIKFLYYFLHHLSDYFPRVAVGATVKSLRRRHFEQLPVTLTNLSEQRSIVAILDKALEGIGTVVANVERNLANARYLFSIKLQTAVNAPGHGWPKKTLREVSMDFGRGKSKHRPRGDVKLLGGNYPLIQTGDVANSDHLIIRHSQTYNEVGLAQSKLWPKGTVCIAIVGANVGETAILDFDACFPDSVIGVVVDDRLADNEYVEFLLQTFKVTLKESGKGTARDNINLGTFENQKLPFPAVDEQRRIVADVKMLADQTQMLRILYEQKLLRLAEVKQSLLKKAFSGELTMRPDKVLPEAAK